MGGPGSGNPAMKKGSEFPGIAPRITTENAARLSRMKTGKHYPKMSLSAKLRQLKKKGLTDETAQQMYEVLTNSDLSSLQIRLHLQKLLSQAKDSKEETALVGKVMDWHKLHHGDKHHIDLSGTVKHDINIQLIVEPVDKIKKVDGKEED